jgi:hypothetical protein
MPAGESMDIEDQGTTTLTRRSMLRRVVAFGVATPAVLTLLQACGGDDEKKATATAPAPAASTVEATEPPATTAETPAAAGTPVEINATSGGSQPPTSAPLPKPPGA